jgi:release factor glutamine methyltransferase
MGMAILLVPTFTNYSVIMDDNAPDQRVGANMSAAKLSQFNGPLHIEFIGCHCTFVELTNSKTIFHNIIGDLKLTESKDEINAIAFAVLNYFGISRTDVVANRPVDLEYTTLRPIISRLNQHEPLQYILNEAWFCGYRFYVDPAVLIPRPETELLVEESKRLLEQNVFTQPPRILDIGTGSGCIAISLSLIFPDATVWGIDVSEHALAVAKRNAQALKAKVKFSRLDILNESLKGEKFDLIVSNPPYISIEEKAGLSNNVLDYEPHLALFASETDDLIFYRTIAKAAKELLKPSGSLAVEINERLGEEVKSIFYDSELSNIQLKMDYAGKARIVLAHT